MSNHRGPSAYDDPGTPDEISRRTFMANATLVLSGVIGLGLTIPIAGALIPKAEAGGSTWTPLDQNEWKQLQASTDKAVRIDFMLKTKDAYLPESSHPESVWGIKVDPARFQKDRAELFDPKSPAKAPFPPPIVVMGFVLFSPICPHLGCFYTYHSDTNKFVCPCHGSQFDHDGVHVSGPAARGLDPLPLREQNGQAEVTWIRYAPTTPARIVVSYTS